MITNNVLLAYEITHLMHKRKGGRKGLVAAKLDMSKSYDRVEWGFLERVMIKMGFAEQWGHLIMKCVRSVSYRVKINRSLSEVITPGRGLRQGEPCKGFLCYVVPSGAGGLYPGGSDMSWSSKDKPPFFADDSLIVMKATVEGAAKLQQILALYEDQSGQMINKEKSNAMFSKGTSANTRGAVLAGLGIVEESFNQ